MKPFGQANEAVKKGAALNRYNFNRCHETSL
jgi:hypothetical protein